TFHSRRPTPITHEVIHAELTHGSQPEAPLTLPHSLFTPLDREIGQTPREVESLRDRYRHRDYLLEDLLHRRRIDHLLDDRLLDIDGTDHVALAGAAKPVEQVRILSRA